MIDCDEIHGVYQSMTLASIRLRTHRCIQSIDSTFSHRRNSDAAASCCRKIRISEFLFILLFFALSVALFHLLPGYSTFLAVIIIFLLLHCYLLFLFLDATTRHYYSSLLKLGIFSFQGFSTLSGRFLVCYTFILYFSCNRVRNE